VKGTSSYWVMRGMELKSIIEQMDAPTFFFTLTAADVHWDDMHRLFPGEPTGIF
jgi:hypothetical protein